MSFLSRLPGGRSPDMAIDLGTANTLVYVEGRGIVTSEPSVVAVDSRSGEVHAVGAGARRMIGRTPATISAVRPLRHGVIADFEVTEQMLRHFMRTAANGRLARPRIVMCAPSGITEVEQRAVEEAALSAGARRVHLIEEPLAAAIGAGVAIEEPVGNMVVDVGGGTSEVAVISLGGIVVSESVRTGGYDLDEAIIGYLKRQHGLTIGQTSAETIKLEVGCARPLADVEYADVRGRDNVTGLPKQVQLSSEDVRAALEEPLQRIMAAVRATLDRTPPELAADIANRGILLAGGGSLLRGFGEALEDETRMSTYLAEAPLECVALGAGASLESFEALERANGSRARARRVSAR